MYPEIHSYQLYLCTDCLFKSFFFLLFTNHFWPILPYLKRVVPSLWIIILKSGWQNEAKKQQRTSVGKKGVELRSCVSYSYGQPFPLFEVVQMQNLDMHMSALNAVVCIALEGKCLLIQEFCTRTEDSDYIWKWIVMRCKHQWRSWTWFWSKIQ